MENKFITRTIERTRIYFYRDDQSERDYDDVIGRVTIKQAKQYCKDTGVKFDAIAEAEPIKVRMSLADFINNGEVVEEE